MHAEGAKILLVDDEAGIRFFLEEVLRGEGYQVVGVDSGEAALAQIAEQEFDLALVDLKMRGVGGLEVLSALRQRSSSTAVIVLTAHASLETAVEALRQGAHDYLFKPCKTVEIRESVRRGLLKRQRELRQQELLAQLEQSLADRLEEVRAVVPGQPAPAVETPLEPSAPDQDRFLRWGGLIVDLLRHVITLDGHLLELSPTEFNLLAYLTHESPRVVPPRELVREVQGYDVERWEARDVIRYHVYRLRRKIQSATGRSDLIRTVRGVGYTIQE